MLRWQRLDLCLMSLLLTVLWDAALNHGCLGTARGSTWTATHPCHPGCSPAPMLPLLKFPSDELSEAISMPLNHLAHLR